MTQTAKAGPRGLLRDLRHPLPALRRYLRVVVWELGWAWSNQRHRLLFVQTMAGIRTLMQGGVILLLHSGLDNPEANRGLVVLAAVGLLVVTSICAFLFRSGVNRLAVLFEEQISYLAIEKVRTDSARAAPTIRLIVFPGSRFAGRSSGIAIATCTDLLRIAVLLVSSAALDVALTAVVTALIVPTLLVHLILNRRIHRNAADRRGKTILARDALRDALAASGSRDSSSAFVRSPEYQDQLKGYERYINTSAFADAVSSISVVIGVAFVAYWLFATDVAADGGAVNRTAYVVAILLYLQALGSLLKGVATFTRLFSQTEAVYLFLNEGFVPDGMRLDGEDYEGEDA